MSQFGDYESEYHQIEQKQIERIERKNDHG